MRAIRRTQESLFFFFPFPKLSLNSNAFINWQPDHCLASFKKAIVSFHCGRVRFHPVPFLNANSNLSPCLLKDVHRSVSRRSPVL